MLNKILSDQRRILTATLLSALLISVSAGSSFVECGVADPMVVFVPSPIEVVLPQANKTYPSLIVNFATAVPESTWHTYIYSNVQCFLDGELLSDLKKIPFSVSMKKLGIGRHVVRVAADATVQIYGDS